MANSYLTRTPSSTGNRKTFTISVWIKRSEISTNQKIFEASPDGSNRTEITFKTTDELQFYAEVGGVQKYNLKSNAKLRDTNAFYHIVCAVDTTQSTSSNRVKMYINGEQITSLADNVYPDQNFDTLVNYASQINVIGRRNPYSDFYFNGYLSHLSLVDGQALAPTVFGETDSTSGIWKFKSPSGVTWGTNGFHLKFENSGNLGLDSSGNGNNLTVSGNGTQALDTPTNVHATLNALSKTVGDTTVFTNGNNTVTKTGSNSDNSYAYTTIGAMSGKWYLEAKQTANVTYGFIGVDTIPNMEESIRNDSNPGDSGVGYRGDGQKRVQGSNSSFGNTYGQNDIIQVALDLDNNFVYFGKNGTWQNSGVPTSGGSGTGGIAITGISGYNTEFMGSIVGDNSSGEGSATWNMNFGNGYFGTTAITSAGSNGNGSLFEYDVPSGYYALNTKNINTYG
jgi:hypothetical protein